MLWDHRAAILAHTSNFVLRVGLYELDKLTPSFFNDASDFLSLCTLFLNLCVEQVGLHGRPVLTGSGLHRGASRRNILIQTRLLWRPALAFPRVVQVVTLPLVVCDEVAEFFEVKLFRVPFASQREDFLHIFNCIDLLAHEVQTRIVQLELAGHSHVVNGLSLFSREE